MKKVLVVLIVMIMVLSMAACTPSENNQGGAGDQNSTEEKSTEKLSFKVMMADEPSSDSPFVRTLDMWAEETGNSYEIMVIPYDDQLIKFPQMAKNNDLPDLLVSTRLHQLYPEEFIDMTSLVDESKMEETALKIVGKDYSSDKITGLTLDFTTTCVYINKDAFELAGIDIPEIGNEWTWDELYANAKTLQEKGNVKYGFAMDPSRGRYDSLIYANGGSLLRPDGDTYVITVNSEENVSTLEGFVALNNEGVMPKAIWAGGSTDNPGDYFKNGDVGILLSGSWNYSNFTSEISGFEMALMPSPKGPNGRAAIIGGEALCIPNNAEGKDGASAFVRWLYTAENFQKYINIEKGPSGFKGVAYSPDNEADMNNVAVLQSEVQSVPDAYMDDEAAAWRNYLDNEYRDNIKRAVAGEMTPQEALDDFAQQLADKSGWKID